MQGRKKSFVAGMQTGGQGLVRGASQVFFREERTSLPITRRKIFWVQLLFFLGYAAGAVAIVIQFFRVDPEVPEFTQPYVTELPPQYVYEYDEDGSKCPFGGCTKSPTLPSLATKQPTTLAPTPPTTHAPTPNTPAPTPNTPAPTPNTPAPTPNTPAPTPNTPAPTPNTPAPTPNTPAPTPNTPAPTPDTPAPTPDTPAPTPDTPAPTPDTPAPTPDTPAPTPDTPAPTPE